MFLNAFYFPGEEAESDFLFGLKTTYDQTVYPYGVLPKAGLDEIIFRPVTILYDGNGSGKSTALNVIAEKLRQPFHRIKIAFDVTSVIIAGCFCLIFLHALGSVGIGTVVIAIMLGTMVGVYSRAWGAPLKRWLARERK